MRLRVFLEHSTESNAIDQMSSWQPVGDAEAEEASGHDSPSTKSRQHLTDVLPTEPADDM